MNNKDIVKHIMHYMDKDFSKGAIMLTGPWGVGKSFFVQNQLAPEIRDNGKKCIIISLYGLKSLDEISKSIYFEMRLNALKKQSEVFSAGTLVAKTVAKGVISFLGLSIKASENDLMDLYKSVNLEGTLIVLEDIERCQINIIELLGFVNNLTEQDGAKVLLVVNEEELLQYQYIDDEDKELSGIMRDKKPTEETAQYLSIKEKTVSDTIRFEGDIHSAIRDIIVMYDNPILNRFNSKESIEDIYSIMYLCQCYNLRSLIYACQKTVDIYEELQEDHRRDESFTRTILMGNIFFVLRVKSGAELRWGREKYYSTELGQYGTPLLKFCYDYIVYQKHDFSQAEETRKSLEEKQEYDSNKSNCDKDIEILRNYYIHTENQVLQAVGEITRRLENPSDISFYMYGTIATYLIIIKSVLKCDIEEAKQRLVRNLKGRGDKLQIEQIFRILMDANTGKDELEEYRSLRAEMEGALYEEMVEADGFNYLPNQIESFAERAIKNRDRFISRRGFARFLDVDKMATLFSTSSLEQKQTIRALFLEMYHSSNIGEFLRDDCDSLKLLKAKIIEDADEGDRDKIEKLQYNYFEDNLAEIIKKMS